MGFGAEHSARRPSAARALVLVAQCSLALVGCIGNDEPRGPLSLGSAGAGGSLAVPSSGLGGADEGVAGAGISGSGGSGSAGSGSGGTAGQPPLPIETDASPGTPPDGGPSAPVADAGAGPDAALDAGP